MIISILNTLYKYGGAEQAARDLFFGLKNNDIQAKFLHRQKLDFYPKDTINIPQTKFDNYLTNYNSCLVSRLAKNIFIPSSFATLPRIIKNINPDIVHLHNLHASCCNSSISYWSLFYLSKKYPVVWTLHDGDMICDCAWFGCEKYSNGCFNCHKRCGRQNKIYVYLSKIIKNTIYKTSKFHLVVPSLWLEDKIKEIYGNRFKIHHIPYGIDTSLFKPIINAKKLLNLPKNKIIILFVSADIDNKRKGIKYPLKALEMINLSNIYLLAVGEKPEYFKAN